VCVRACVSLLQTLTYLRIVYAREWANFQERLISKADVRAALGDRATPAAVKEAAFLPGVGAGHENNLRHVPCNAYPMCATLHMLCSVLIMGTHKKSSPGVTCLLTCIATLYQIHQNQPTAVAMVSQAPACSHNSMLWSAPACGSNCGGFGCVCACVCCVCAHVLLQVSPCTSGAMSSWHGPACEDSCCSAQCTA
jgi:hypothetical protein